nr:nischarin [Leptinotarsa decemlineata]
MACFWSNQNKTIIEIPSTEESNNITYYKIKVLVGDFHWTITHRYSEFYDLHNQLVIDHGVSKEILPSKKVIRNKCPIFIENRRRGLEEYLQKILLFLKRTMPKILVDFLHFNVYDIFFLLQDLSSKLFLEADFILTSRKPHYFSTLELYAISEFLKKPLLDNTESRFDISPVLDLCSQLNFIKIIGGTKPYLQSNIIFNKLHFELSPFKELKSLHMKNVSFEVIFSLGNLRNTLVNLTVNNTDVTTISQILQCDVIHKHNLEGSQVNTLFHCDTLITSSNIVKSLSINDPEYISEINQVEDLERNRFNGLKFFIYKVTMREIMVLRFLFEIVLFCVSANSDTIYDCRQTIVFKN